MTSHFIGHKDTKRLGHLNNVCVTPIQKGGLKRVWRSQRGKKAAKAFVSSYQILDFTFGLRRIGAFEKLQLSR